MSVSHANSYSLEQIRVLVEGELIGDAEVRIHALEDLRRAKETDIAFLSSSKYVSALADCCAGCVLLKPSDVDAYEGNKILVEDPYVAYAKISALFDRRVPLANDVSVQAFVHETAVLGSNVSVSPGCFIGEGAVIGNDVELYPGVYIGEHVKVGDRVTLYPNVVLYHHVELGSRIIIHANTSVGSDGFGFAPSKAGWQKIHQLGRVVIGSDVEIGANTCIDRGALGDTRIEDGVIIDNQVHIAHNVVIGEGSAIAGCVGIAGSTTLGKNCILGGAVSISGHLNIADNTYFHGATVVTKGNAETGSFASAAPLQDLASWRKNSVRMRQLDALFAKVKKLEKLVESDRKD